MSKKREPLRASSGILVEAGDCMPKGPEIKGDETGIRRAKSTANLDDFMHNSF
jgi:hypothetical protein